RVARMEQGEHRREQVEEQPRVLVEPLVEITGGQHAAHVLDEPSLVEVGQVAQAPAETGEAQGRGEDEDRDEEDPRGGAVHREVLSYFADGTLDGCGASGRARGSRRRGRRAAGLRRRAGPPPRAAAALPQ